MNARHAHSRRRRRSERKDRLIQTRVAEDLEQALKREAARRRLTVSHLIRNTLEDAFNLVEDVTADVEQLVSGSVELAAAVGRDARRLASIVRGEPGEPGEGQDPEPVAEGDPVSSQDRAKGASSGEDLRADDVEGPAENDAPQAGLDRDRGESSALAQVYGWNRIIANRGAECERCHAVIGKGDDALIGLSDEPGPRVWLCAPCGDDL